MKKKPKVLDYSRLLFIRIPVFAISHIFFKPDTTQESVARRVKWIRNGRK